MTEKKLVTIYHPTLPGVEQEVYASEAATWTDQGWRKTKPQAAQSK